MTLAVNTAKHIKTVTAKSMTVMLIKKPYANSLSEGKAQSETRPSYQAPYLPDTVQTRSTEGMEMFAVPRACNDR